MLLLSNKWAVSGGGSAVHAIRAAVPSNIGAAASGALGSITLLVGSHLHKLLFLGNKGAAASGALGSVTLLVSGHLGNLGLLGNKWAVSGGGSAVHAIRAAVPSNIGAAASGALGS